MKKIDEGRYRAGFSWSAEIIIDDHKGNIRRFTEKNIKKLELVD